MRSDYSAYHKLRSLLQFDVASNVPSYATITEAKLELYCNFVYQGTASAAGGGTVFPVDFDIHKMLIAWDEGTADNADGDASWNERQPGLPWASPGGFAGADYETAIAATFVANDASVENTWMAFDITALAQDWVTTPSTDLGVMVKLKQDNLSIYRNFRFDSSESTNTTLRPKLTVTYNDVPTMKTTYYVRDASGQVIATYED